MDDEIQMALGLLIASLGGAAIGMERRHSEQAGKKAPRFGSLRTFTLLGMVAGLAGLLWRNQMEVAGAVLLASAAAFILIAYYAASQVDIDGTTEVAGLVVLGAGFLSGLGWWVLSSGMIALTSLVLVEKTRLHDLADRMPDAGLKAGFRFAVMALVILPLLPEGPYGPWGGVKPRELWLVVLLLSGFSFAGYLARHWVGAGHGYVVTGILGGVISSTNATLVLSRTSRIEPESGTALATGVISACTVMYVRVAMASSILNPQLGSALTWYWIPPAIGGALIAVLGLRIKDAPSDTGDFPQNPLEVRSALQMAVLFQVVMMIVNEVQKNLGNLGVLATGAVVGFAEVDGLTISMAKVATDAAQVATAAMAVAIGCVSNSFLKLGIAMVVGQGKFRPMAGAGFAVMILLAGAAIGWKALH